MRSAFPASVVCTPVGCSCCRVVTVPNDRCAGIEVVVWLCAGCSRYIRDLDSEPLTNLYWIVWESGAEEDS